MSLGDWTKYQNQGWNFEINVVTPIVSQGSGRFSPAPFLGGTNEANVVVTNLSGRTKGVIQGKIRSLFRYTNPPGGGYGFFGFMCMQSVENISGGSGNFYAGGYDHNTGRFHIRKATGGSLVAVTSGVGLAQSVVLTPGNNVVFSLELEWISDVTEIGGTALFLRVGSLTDFSDLATVASVLDDTTPIVTSVAESIGIITGNPVVSNWTLDFDETTFFIP